MLDHLLSKLEAKRIVLVYLHNQGRLHADLFEAAKQALGAEVTAALPSIGRVLLSEVQEEIQRLEERQFRIGDVVTWKHGREQQTSKITAVHDGTVRLDFGGKEPGYCIEREKVTGVELPKLKLIQAACGTALGGREITTEQMMAFARRLPTEAAQYSTRDLDD